MTHYCNPNNHEHVANIRLFADIEARFPWMELRKPSPEKAPWHEQAIVKSKGGASILLNFWPCALKAQRDGCKSVHGIEAIRLMIAEAIDDSQDDFQVVEASE